jgi:hypothetical protein
MYTPLPKDEEEEEEEEAEIGKGEGGGRALPTYSIQYSRGREFILLQAHLLLHPEEAIANAIIADSKHLLPLQIRIIAPQLRVVLFMFCANERAEGRREEKEGLPAMFTNGCVPWKAELFRSTVGTERKESEREGESAVPGGQGAASSELRQKTKIRTENSVWSTTSEIARRMSPFRFGTMAEHASARRGKFPFSFGKSSEHAPELHENVPF